MSATVKRLRWATIVAACLLLAALAGFFFFARFKQRLLRRDLPKRLGVNIQQDSTGFTLSRSQHGRTQFTLHAARAVQLKNDGNAQLSGVQIVLYGQGASQRRDRIRGDNFAYDPKTQIVTAHGGVLIDLQSPDADSQPGDDAHSIHLRTSDLVFDQKSGQARTGQLVQFTLPQISGTAIGVEYDTQAGLITLQSAVNVQMKLDGGPAQLHSAHATLDKQTWRLVLANADLRTRRRQARADLATVWLRPDGSADHMLAQGNAAMTTDDGSVVNAPVVSAKFNAESKPVSLLAKDGVTLRQQPATDPAVMRTGQSREALLELDPDGRPAHMTMSGAVLIKEVDSRSGITQSLAAENLQIKFDDGRAQQLFARGAPKFIQTTGAPANGLNKQLQADLLEGTLTDGKALQQVRGVGHTVVAQSGGNGEVETSTADTLLAHFAANGKSAAQITSAVQTGNVAIHRHVAAVGNKPQQTTLAHAGRAEYEHDGETVTLTESPRINDVSGADQVLDLLADRIILRRANGDADADGAVKGTLSSQNGAQVSHVVAQHANLLRASQTVTFTGSPRVWQQGNSVQAPTIVVTQQPRGLDATAVGNTLVHTTLVSQDQEDQKKSQPPVRITSRKMTYSQAENRARFTGGVLVEDANGTLRSDQTDVFLKATHPSAASGASQKVGPAGTGMLSGDLDRIIATGNVVLTQPLRRGTGQQLIYTADNGLFVLTGTDGRPPRVEDRAQGTVTGEALQFRSKDERVDIVGGAGRTVTTTRLAK